MIKNITRVICITYFISIDILTLNIIRFYTYLLNHHLYILWVKYRHCIIINNVKGVVIQFYKSTLYALKLKT